MDPYDERHLYRSKQSFLQRLLDRLPFGLVLVGPWGPSDELQAYPATTSNTQEVQFDVSGDDAGMPVAFVVYDRDHSSAVGRTVLDRKRDNRRTRYELGRHAHRRLLW